MHFNVVFHDHTLSSVKRICDEHRVPKTVIEIGVFEGHTTVNMAHIFSQVHADYSHYAIDPFLASENLKQEVLDNAERQFRENISDFSCITLIKQKSLSGLVYLFNRDVRADLIYVDGSHFAPDVLADCVLGFELLAPNGIMLFDDAVSWRYMENITDSPKLAIDNFIQVNWNRLKVLEMPNGYQVAIQRTV